MPTFTKTLTFKEPLASKRSWHWNKVCLQLLFLMNLGRHLCGYAWSYCLSPIPIATMQLSRVMIFFTQRANISIRPSFHLLTTILLLTRKDTAKAQILQLFPRTSLPASYGVSRENLAWDSWTLPVTLPFGKLWWMQTSKTEGFRIYRYFIN